MILKENVAGAFAQFNLEHYVGYMVVFIAFVARLV